MWAGEARVSVREAVPQRTPRSQQGAPAREALPSSLNEADPHVREGHRLIFSKKKE